MYKKEVLKLITFPKANKNKAFEQKIKLSKK